VPRTRADSIRADSIARADSILMVRELERIRGEPRAQMGDTTRRAQPTNARLLPDISAVGDFIADLSPDGSTIEGARRIDIREVEVALQAAVDPYFRGDIFLGVSDAEGIAIEQAFLTTTALPWGLETRLGRFLMPVGKQNTTHRHDLHSIEYPHVIQDFFGAEGLKGTGVSVSKIASPLGFFQELQLTAVDQFGGGGHGHDEEAGELVTDEPPNRRLSGLGYSARLRNYWDLTQAANVELSFSGITGRRAFALIDPSTCSDPDDCEPLPDADGHLIAGLARQTVVGADFTYRWRPLQQGLYKSFILQAELMQQVNPDNPKVSNALPGEVLLGRENEIGAYVFARYQLSRRLFVGGRYDVVGEKLFQDGNLTAASGYLQFYPSEFSKLLAGYEALRPEGVGEKVMHRILLQAAFSIGPHKPHPF
jgi:hypothetical protein